MNTVQSVEPNMFVERLRREGSERYHAHHPFHVLMHEGRLSKAQLQQWVLNRYYYQTRIPIKDAIILSKSEDIAFRRTWIGRIQDHDGDEATDGGLALWRRLALGVGLDEETLMSYERVLPGVRFACDAYVTFVREAPLVEAVASSLTELFAPTLIAARIAAWEQHYPWIDSGALDYFRSRLSRAPKDARHALEFVIAHATTLETQLHCIEAVKRKTEILWHILDSLHAAFVEGYDSDSAMQPSKVGR
jgi:pyrroloquinoline-quinone synthase